MDDLPPILVAEGVRKVYRSGGEEITALRGARPRRSRAASSWP